MAGRAMGFSVTPRGRLDAERHYLALVDMRDASWSSGPDADADTFVRYAALDFAARIVREWIDGEELAGQNTTQFAGISALAETRPARIAGHDYQSNKDGSVTRTDWRKGVSET
jgi:hypothetical protein